MEVHDPLADPEKIEKEYGIPLLTLEDMQPADAVILAVPHDAYRHRGWTLVTSRLKNGEGLVVDVRACLDRRDYAGRHLLVALVAGVSPRALVQRAGEGVCLSTSSGNTTSLRDKDDRDWRRSIVVVSRNSRRTRSAL